ncbi:MAG TPA: molybdenum cofactor guanylyltransferase [Ktedonobacterales bacterium]
MIGNAGVILAGGKSRRMGENKAELLFKGEPLLARVARRVAPVVDELLIIGPESLTALIPWARVVSDLVPEVGPLGGLYTALRATSSARVFLLACDMPFVRPRLVRAMLQLAVSDEEAEAVVLRAGTRLHPLHSVYSAGCLPVVEQAIASGDYSMHALLARITVVTVSSETVSREDPDGISPFNVNTAADWERALRLADELDVPDAASDGR